MGLWVGLGLVGCGHLPADAPQTEATSQSIPPPPPPPPPGLVSSGEAPDDGLLEEEPEEEEREDPTMGGGGEVALGAVNVASPALEPTAVKEVVSRERAALDACYQDALADDPELGGTLRVTFTIGGDGRVTEARGTGAGPLSAAGVEDCVVEAFRAMEFPPTNSPRTTTVTYPLTFVPR